MQACEFSPMLSRYHDRELPAAMRARLLHHLPDCSPCTLELQQMQLISQSLRSVEYPTASAPFVARLESLADHITDVAILRFVTRLTAMAAAILVAAMCYGLIRQQPAGHPQVIADSSSIESLILDPDSAVRTAGLDSSAPEPQLDFIVQGLSGGRP